MLASEYRLERVLGAGGFGITYQATDLPLNRPVAIKEYFPSDFAAREGSRNVRSKSAGHSEDYRWGLDRFGAQWNDFDFIGEHYNQQFLGWIAPNTLESFAGQIVLEGGQ